MNSTNLALEVFPSSPQKKVRISTIFEVRNLSREAKEWNRVNNFSKKERNETLQNILSDRDFLQYLEARSSRNSSSSSSSINTNLSPKQYRNQILSQWQKREELLSEIRNLNTPSSNHPNHCPIKTIILFFNNMATNYRPPCYLETPPYYKSFLYPI
jgi:hypothetical protein